MSGLLAGLVNVVLQSFLDFGRGGSLSQPVSKTDKNRTETVEILFISGGAVFTARLKPEFLPINSAASMPFPTPPFTPGLGSMAF